MCRLISEAEILLLFFVVFVVRKRWILCSIIMSRGRDDFTCCRQYFESTSTLRSKILMLLPLHGSDCEDDYHDQIMQFGIAFCTMEQWQLGMVRLFSVTRFQVISFVERRAGQDFCIEASSFLSFECLNSCNFVI